MSQFSRHLSWATLALVLTCATVWAQATAGINGTIRDDSGAVLPGVTITVTQTDTGVTHSALSTWPYQLTRRSLRQPIQRARACHAVAQQPARSAPGRPGRRRPPRQGHQRSRATCQDSGCAPQRFRRTATSRVERASSRTRSRPAKCLPSTLTWDEQIFCVPSEEQRLNRLIRDGGAGEERP